MNCRTSTLAPLIPDLTAPRSLAYTILGLARTGNERWATTALDAAAGHLATAIRDDPAWPWFEAHLGPRQRLPTQALLAAGIRLHDSTLTTRALSERVRAGCCPNCDPSPPAPTQGFLTDCPLSTLPRGAPCVDCSACPRRHAGSPPRSGSSTRRTAWPNRAAANPTGVGLGVFGPDGTAQVHKRPIAAYQDAEFAREARQVTSRTFLAHVRYASTGEPRIENTHPFLQDGRLFAHNGVVTGLDRLRDRVSEQLGEPVGELAGGDTDSELVFALITAYARRGGDLGAAIVEAAGWIAANLPLYALNLIVTTPDDLWALRYPDTHPLYVLARPAGGHHGHRHLEHASAPGTLRVRSGDLATVPATVVASERMDEDPHWRSFRPGELLHVAAGQHLTSQAALHRAPAHPLTLADLHPRAAASQQTASA